MIHVCPLSKVQELAAQTQPEKVVSILDPDFETPSLGLGSDHLRLAFHDIHVPTPGAVLPEREHLLELISFLSGWSRSGPLLIHCRAGVGRSTAAGFVAACLHQPDVDEFEVARTLRAVAPLARPNETLVTLADSILERGGRMSAAISETGRDLEWIEIDEGVPFEIPLTTGRNTGHPRSD